MKQNIIKAALLAVLALPALTACEFDQFPTTSIPNEGSWGSVADARRFNVGVRKYTRDIACYGWYTMDLQADYYQPGLGYGNNGGLTYNWSFTSSENGGLWSGMYTAIGQANNYINNCDQIEPETGAEEAAMNQYKAEAYFLRAYAYANLVTRYCEDYDPARAEQQLGLPLVTVMDINEKPARASLAATFKFIKDDIAMARSLIQRTDATTFVNDDSYFLNGVHARVLDALEARVDLYMENYTEAIQLANSLIEDSNYELATTAANLFEQFRTDFGPEFIYVFYASNSEGFIDYGNYHSWSTTEEAYSPFFLPSQGTIDAFATNDIRRAAFFEQVEKVKQMSESATGIYLFNKFPGNSDLFSSNNDPDHTYYQARKPFRIAEMYLIAAEAAYRLNDVANAQKFLSGLRTARGLEAATSIGDRLFSDIQDEWFREFIGEGQRLDCLKRWHQGFTRDGRMQAGNIIMQADPERNIALSVSADDQRFLWEIPSQDLLANPNLVPNWGN
ncbi:MAG: RagB/SusD family nutrient uptake outer membrane protein [Alloprevotella sp.]|nr:RagB/SusD family nutrient uptake outer membrane protein [Alloprevotella sp.]